VTTTPSTTQSQRFLSFGLKENPFRVSSDPRFLFFGKTYEAVFSELLFGIESHRGLMVLTGEPGTGKTTLLRHFLQWLSQKRYSTSYIFHSHLDSEALFGSILRDFGIAVESSKKNDLVAELQRWLEVRQAEGDSPVLIIDEAQGLSTRALSELCLLLNLENSRGKLLQIVLAGQNELEEKLRRPVLRQLRQRIMVRSRLPVMSLEDTGEYIASCLRCAGGSLPPANVFPTETVQAVYCYAQGVPRMVNLLCENALIAAYAERQMHVSPENVRRAAAEFDLAPPGPYPAILRDMPAEFGLLHPVPVPDATQELVPPPPALERHAPLAERVAEVPSPASEKPRSTVVVIAARPPAPPADAPAASPEFEARPVGPQRSAGRAEGGLHAYWREVASSFARDWRQLFASFRSQAPTSNVLLMKKYNLRRDVIQPVSRWLSKPVHFGSRADDPAASHPVRRGAP
jgi:general secretion pathway protein A